jgi:hypothetical protein
MAVYDLTKGGNYGPLAQGLDRVYCLENTIDFAVNKVGASDTIEAFNLPAYHTVLHLVCELLTSEGTTATIEIGTMNDPDGLVDSVNLMTPGITKNSGAADEIDIGKIWSTATPIVIDPGHALATGKIKLTALIADLSAVSTSLI